MIAKAARSTNPTPLGPCIQSMLRCVVVRWSAASALILLLACENPVHLPAPEKSPFDQAVEDLMSADPDRRIVAAGRLARERLTLRERLDALTLAATASAADSYGQDAGVILVGAASSAADDDVLPVVERLFDDYSRFAQQRALQMLGTSRSRAAAETWMRVVVPRIGTDRIGSIPIGSLGDDPRHADVFLPTILQYIDDENSGWNLTYLGLRLCKKQPPGSIDLSVALPTVLARYAQHHRALRPYQRRAKTNFRFEDETYSKHRAWASLLLDLLGCFERRDVEKVLKEALELDDPRLQYFALTSQLRQGSFIERRHLDAVAANPETRAWLFETLQEAGRVELMPQRFMTQGALAESALVRWLIDDDELGVAPAEIELADTVVLDTHSEIGIVDYYVFRYRVDPPHWASKYGWLAGVAGGYRRDLAPTTQSDNQTHSAYEAIDSRSAEGHVGDLDRLYQAWREGVDTYDGDDYDD